MKKTLSWLIVLAMLIAMVPAVFAAEEPQTAGFVASELGYENGADVADIEGEVISFAFSDGGNSYSNCPRYYNTGTAIRFYNQNTLTISVAEGYEIVSVDITTGGGSNAMTADNTVLTNASAVYGDTLTVLTPEDGTQDIVMGYTKSSGHWRVQAVNVTYVAVEAEEEEPEAPANALVDGSNTMNMEGNVPYVEYTYVAESAGTLSVEFTEIGYEGSAGYSTWDVGERFAGANGMGILFAAYLNGEQLSDLYKGSIAVEAGQEVVLKLEFTNTSNFFYRYVKSAKVNISLGEGSVGGDEPEVEGGVINVETTDNGGYFDKYEFTAEAAGTYTFSIPAGLGVWEAEKYDNDFFSAPIVDFMGNEEGYEYELEMAEGEVFSFYIGAATKQDWVISYTFEAGEVEEPGEGGGDEPEQPGDEPAASLVLGTNNASAADVLYSFTAESAGILTIDASSGRMQYGNIAGSVYTYGNLILEVNGVAVDGTAQGVYEMEVSAGQVVTIKVAVASQMYVGSTINFVLSIAEPPAPALNDGSNSAEAGIEYVYTATANGTLTIDASSGTMKFYGSSSTFAGTMYSYGNLVLKVDGVAIDGENKGGTTMEVTEGQEVRILVEVLNANITEARPTIVLTLEEGGNEPENLLALGTNSASASDVLYSFTAESAGTLTIDASSGRMQYGNIAGSVYNYGNLILEVDGVAIPGSAMGVYEMEVSAGQVVTIQVKVVNSMYANATIDFVLTLESGSVVPGPGEGEDPQPGAGSGTHEDPFIVDEMPYEAEQESSQDLYYQWTATENGTLTLSYADGVGTLGGSSVQDMADYLDNGKALKVAAGDVIEINYWSGNGFTLSFEAEAPAGPEVGSGSGTAGDPYIIDVPYEVEQGAEEDLYYQFTAPEDGKILILFTNGVVGVSGNSVGSWETMPGGKYIEVLAGDVIEINAWNGNTGFSVEYEEVSDEFTGTILDSIKDVTINIEELGTPMQYKWIADQAGTLTISLKSYTWGGTYLFTATVNGVAFNYGDQVLEVAVGDELIFEFNAPIYSSTGTLVFTGIFEGEVIEPDGSQENPFIIDQIPGNYSYDGVNTRGLYYKWIATEATTLELTVHRNVMLSRPGFSTPSKVRNGDYDTYTIELAEGEELVIRLMSMMSNVTGEMAVAIAGGEEECQHTNTDVRNENVVDATCEHGGSYDKVTYCVDCEEIISTEHITTEALDHNYVDGVCTECGAEDPNYEPPVVGCDHNYVDGVCTECGEADPNYVPPVEPGCDHNYVDGICTECGEKDPDYNPETGSFNVMAIALIAMMSVTAVVVTAKKSDEE